MWYNIRKAAIILDFKPFFSPLAGQPKKMTHYTLPAAPSWYNIPELRAKRGQAFAAQMRFDDGLGRIHISPAQGRPRSQRRDN